MKNIVFTLLTLSLASCVLPTHDVHAQDNPVQLALFNPIQLVPEGQAVTAVRLSLLYGKNTSVSGLDLGLVNHTTSGTSKGFQFGFLGMNEAEFVGWMYNAVNLTQGATEGLQTGCFNYARSMNGVQLGFVNYAVTLEGLQIGLVNIIEQGGVFPVLPIVNWSF